MRLFRLLLLCLLPLTSYADPAAFVGVTYAFGNGGSSGIGLTAKVLSDDKDENGVAALGASYYPFSAQPFGLDVSAGYAFDDAAVLLGWDFLQDSIVLSAGWADIENKRHHHKPAAATTTGTTTTGTITTLTPGGAPCGPGTDAGPCPR